jgi:hypothetical protein
MTVIKDRELKRASDAFRAFGYNVTVNENRERVDYPSLGELVSMLTDRMNSRGSNDG